MLRDGGIGGYLIFLIPNAIGAAAMGWVLRRDDQSFRFVANHELACRAFSWITILFHVFAIAWLSTMLPLVSLLVASFVVLAVHILLWSQGTCLRRAGFIVFLASICLALIYLVNPAPSRPTWPNGASMPADFWILALVCVFGFALCPYLDLTFHRVRQSEGPHASKVSFTVGFCVFFVMMMVFSFMYSGWLESVVSLPQAEGNPKRFGLIAPTLFATHFGLQAWFTIRAHTRELARTDATPRALTASHSQTWLVVFAVVVAISLAAISRYPHGFADLSFGEVGYRVLLGFYGLVFPAYMLIVALPAGGFGKQATGSHPLGARMIMFAVAVGGASPFYFFGFVQRDESLLAPGLAIVIASRVFLPVMSRIIGQHESASTSV